jgi:hypothetical protein
MQTLRMSSFEHSSSKCSGPLGRHDQQCTGDALKVNVYNILFFLFFLLSYLAISHLFPFYLPYLPCSTDVTKGDSGREGADGGRVQCKEGRGAVSRRRQSR